MILIFKYDLTSRYILKLLRSTNSAALPHFNLGDCRNKNINNPKPEQDLRIYSYIGLALVTIYGAAYYLFPDTLPRGSFDIVLGVTLIVSELLKAIKGGDYHFWMMVLAGWITFSGIEKIFEIDSRIRSTFLMAMIVILLMRFLYNAVKGKYEP